MSKALAAAISALALIQIATPAMAASSDLGDRRIEQLLRQMLTKAAPTEALTLVTRGANVKVVGTIRRVSGFNLPLVCSMFLSDGRGHSEQKSGVVAFNGAVGTCVINIPFTWANTDPHGLLDVGVSVGNEALGAQGNAATVTVITRGSSFGFPEMPLPAQGTTTQLTFNIRM